MIFRFGYQPDPLEHLYRDVPESKERYSCVASSYLVDAPYHYAPYHLSDREKLRLFRRIPQMVKGEWEVRLVS